ncbi:thioredoxin family protein [Spirulina sp. 06S082]|uniref:thioredoxin family protein n=1 Tax=Spirulina sp. 06S082 TaxID=3110248 RepID=UPI002B1EF8D5|nr:thioredoxin family protein [Spirulina sp. 06S082]MEA5469742.1 thioredoxin family protein [Spirulina sp. 06S082]
MTQTQTSASTIGNYAPDFELPGIDGEVYHLASSLELLQGLGVAFISHECPYVQLYLDRLKQIQGEFGDRGFSLMAINANDSDRVPSDNFEQMKIFAQEQTLNFPYLRDPSQDVALGFKVEGTPEVFLVDKSGIICYRGAIDDCPESPQTVTKHYLRNAIAALLENKPISPAKTALVGSPLKWREA